MYKEFFALKRSPFELSPDPFFLFSSDQSREALASISYAVAQRKGFVVMTGEVGTGKTLILRCLFELWEREQVPFAYFIGPKLSTMDFLKYIAFELGIKVPDPTKGNLLRALYGFLLAQFEKDLTTVLIIDEAHQIPPSVLEEVRLLANFETAEQKLLQILLVGQPELDEKLNSVDLRSLKQRIAVRCHLEPLRGEHVRRYIERRLELAGAGPEAATIFPAAATKAIESYSLGIPRLINSICDQALVAACARRIRVVPVEIIDEVASRFRLAPAPIPTAKQTEKPFSPAGRIENSASDRFLHAVPALNAPAMRAPDSDAGIVQLGVVSEKSASATLPSARETSPKAGTRDDFVIQRPRLDQEAINQDTIRGGLTKFDVQPLNEVAEPVRLQFDLPPLSAETASVTTPSTVRPLESAPDRPLAAEPMVLAPPPQRRVGEPATLQTAASASRGASFRSDHVLRAARTFRLHRRFTPALTLSLLIGTAAAAVVAVALPASVFRAHRQAPATVTQQVSSTSETSPAEPAAAVAAAPAPAQPASSLPQLDDLGAHDPIVPTAASRPPTPAGELEHVAPRREVVVGALSRPVPKSPVLLAATEPPPVVGMPAKELEVGNGLAEISLPSPAPRAKTGSELQPPKLVSAPPPVYPSLARIDQRQGIVVIDALVDATGKVTDTKVISGPPSLTGAAMQALRLWKYEPAQLDGKPIAAHINVSINFSLR